jgi:hypothetical protein
MFSELMDMLAKTGAKEISVNAFPGYVRVVVRKKIGGRNVSMQTVFDALEIRTVRDEKILLDHIVDGWNSSVGYSDEKLGGGKP